MRRLWNDSDVFCFVLVGYILSVWNVFYSYGVYYVGVEWGASGLFYGRRMGAPFVE